MTDAIDSQKQLLISLLRSSSTVEQALETYESRIKNKPLPLHPTQGPSSGKRNENGKDDATPAKKYQAIRVQDPRSGRHTPKAAFTKPTGRITKLDARERRRFEREFRKYEKIVEKRGKLRERRKRNERRRKKAKTTEGESAAGLEDSIMQDVNKVEATMENADTKTATTKPQSKKTKQQSAQTKSKTKIDKEDSRTEDEKVKSAVRNASAVRKRRSKRAKKFAESAEVRQHLISLAQSDTLSADSDNDDDAVVDETGDGVVIHRPKPLSSAEKKRKKLLELQPEATNFMVYLELYKLWQSYAAELLGLTPTSGPPTSHGQLQTLASKLTSADFHGAYVVVDRSKCVSRVGLQGIILRDTRSAFVIVTKSNALRVLPKEHTVFRIGVRKPGIQPRSEGQSDQIVREKEKEEIGDKTLELFSFLVYGSQLVYRPADRSGRKFKNKPTGDL
ncbi:hypothetical protein V1509DRAFT_635771 [Lipomyces kononenkoae]